MLKDQVECGVLRIHTNHTLEKIARINETASDAPKTDVSDEVQRFEPEISPFQAWFCPEQESTIQVSNCIIII